MQSPNGDPVYAASTTRCAKVRSTLPKQNSSVPPPRGRTNEGHRNTYSLEERQAFLVLSPALVEQRIPFSHEMASFLVRIFREQSDYLAVVDGWGTVRSPTLRGVRTEAKRLVRAIMDGAFPHRTSIEQAEGVEILRLRLEVREDTT
jgi:hypothetical protein